MINMPYNKEYQSKFLNVNNLCEAVEKVLENETDK